MAELEKKLSDFQESECEKVEPTPQPIDTKACPTCTPDPNFVAPIWWEQADAFLDKRFCEYQVRVYSSQVEKGAGFDTSAKSVEELFERVISAGITKILRAFDKPINNAVRDVLKPASYVKDQYQNLETSQLGIAYLVAIPAFNFDQISQDVDVSGNNEDPESVETGGEIILNVDGLNRKLRQLRLALNTYMFYYATTRSVSKDFVITQVADSLKRIDYNAAILQIKEFKKELNESLVRKNITRIDRTGYFKSQRAEKIKITFKDTDSPFEFKNMYVLTDRGCNEYEKLNVPEESALRSSSMSTVYNFLQNLEKVINDITSRETKPWLDFTLQHFYPAYEVDYGGISDLSEQRKGIECLIELELGIGNGQIIDSLTDEIISAFNKIGDDFAAQACRSIKQVSSKGPIAESTRRKQNKDKPASAQREETMEERYKNEYINKFYDFAIPEFYLRAERKMRSIVGGGEDLFVPTTVGSTTVGSTEEAADDIVSAYLQSMGEVTRENIFEKWEKHFGGGIDFPLPTYKYVTKNRAGIRTGKRTANENETRNILTRDELQELAKDFANTKFFNLEMGSDYNQLQNSPYLDEVKLASEELVQGLGKTYVDGTKELFDRAKDIDPLDFITSIGICGVSSMAGKALECIAAGVTFDDFMDLVLEKIFDFMTLNTLHLFFNGLPADFRDSLDEAVANQFGSDVNLTDLFGIVFAAPESASTPSAETKVSDIAKSKLKVREIQSLFEKFEDPFISATGDERRMLIDQLGNDRIVFDQIIYEMDRAYDRNTKKYYEIELEMKVGGKLRKAKKHIKLFIKRKQVDYKSGSQKFLDSTKRLGNALKKPFVEIGEAAVEIGKAAEDAFQASADFVEDRKKLGTYRDLREVTLNGFDSATTRLQVLESQKVVLEDQIELDEAALLLLNAPLPEDQSVDPFELGYQSSDSASARRSVLQQQIFLATNELQQINNEIPKVKNLISRYETELKELKRLIDEIAIYDDVVDGVQNAWSSVVETTSDSFQQNIVNNITLVGQDPDEAFNQFEEAQRAVQNTALGVKVDVVFDLVFDFIIDQIFDFFSLDELFDMIQSYPYADIIINKVKDFFTKSCPIEPLFVPTPGDFMKTLSLDVCNLEASLTLPHLFLPSIDWKFALEQEFGELFREAIIKIITEVIVNLLKKLLNIIEGSLCKLLEAAGGLVVDAVKDGNLNQIGNRFVDALDEAFCNSGENPETARKRAEELADALFSPLMVTDDSEFEGSAAKAANVISSVASKDELLEAIVATQSSRNRQFEKRIANAVNTLAPELSSVLGNPNAVGSFFMILGSFLPVEDKNRIRDLLAAGVPDQPVSSAICLTDDQLEDWNSLRERLLDDPSLFYIPSGDPNSFNGDDDTGRLRDPSEIVNDLNNKTSEILGDLVGDIASLASDGGPFLGSITNEALKDVCNPENLLNDVSMAEFERQIEEEEIDALYENLSKFLIMGFTFRGGLLSEALRDREDRRELSRRFIKLFNPNYGNSQQELNTKYDNKGVLGQFLMKTVFDKDEDDDGQYPDVQGDFPETVAIAQRKELLETEEGRKYNLGGESNVTVYKYVEGSEDDDFLYNLKVRANNSLNAGSFDYRIRTVEETYEDKALVPSFLEESNSDVILSEKVPVSLSQSEQQYLESLGIEISSFQSKNLRKEVFNSLMRKKSPINKNFRSFYSQAFEHFNKKVSHDLLTNYDPLNPDLLPQGYKYGYVSENLTKDDFTYYNKGTLDKYDRPESAKELGEFKAKNRIIALSPEIYGGRYSNPPFYIEPKQHFGWLELATKAFETPSGCDPKTPPLLSFDDIRTRVKTLNSSMRNDPRLTKDRRCISVKPFDVLLDSKNKAALEGVVRTTLRTYITEFFFTGYGLFSNLQMRPENFDSSLTTYIVKKIKREMMEIGTYTSNKKIRIVRERYWYTFLEQCVQVYQRMIDLDGLEPPDEIYSFLNQIQLALDLFRPIGKKRRREMRKELQARALSNLGPQPPISKPSPGFDRLELLRDNHLEFNLQSVAFRLSSTEERENFFNGGFFDGLNADDVRYASIKKLRFFQNIYFIKMFEKEATIIMSELIKSEISRLNDIVVDGLRDKPYYFDLTKSLFAMESLFPNTESKVGLSSFYLDKQIGIDNPGNVPNVVTDRQIAPVVPMEEPQFIVEKYLRLGSELVDGTIPKTWTDRPSKFKGVVSLSEFTDFIDDNAEQLGSLKFSDVFGNLEFQYEDTLRNIFERGNTSSENVSKLKELNPDLEDEISRSLVYFYTGETLPSEEGLLDTSVKIDSLFLNDNLGLEPVGTIGELNVKYGLRICIAAPEEFFSEEELSGLSSNAELNRKGEIEKSYLFEDGTFILPIIESEVDIIDVEMTEFNPFSGENKFDLECLINKMTMSPEFQIIFEKCFGLKQISSMVGIFCMETLPASIGRDETERNDVSDDPDVDTWDRTINRFAKNYLRREFKSHYLAGTPDGDTVDDDDDPSLLRLFSFSNPFDFDFSIKLPWWKLRRQRFKIYDANSIECADPKKDLQ